MWSKKLCCCNVQEVNNNYCIYMFDLSPRFVTFTKNIFVLVKSKTVIQLNFILNVLKIQVNVSVTETFKKAVLVGRFFSKLLNCYVVSRLNLFSVSVINLVLIVTNVEHLKLHKAWLSLQTLFVYKRLTRL